MKAILTITVSMLLIQVGSSQVNMTNVPSVSIKAGAFVSAQRTFVATYGSPWFLSGVAVRFPVWERFFATGKLSYIFKSNNGYELRQWIVEVGPGYIFPVTEDFSLSVSAGLASTVFLETVPIVTSTLGNTTGSNNYGIYSAVGIERNVPSLSLSFFVEAYYSYLPREYITTTQNFGGGEFLAGVRYNFSR